MEEIAIVLKSAGIHAFLDKWHLVPGEPWQESIENAIANSRTCVVFIGKSGLGPWHKEEMRVLIDRAIKNKINKIIPVLLPNADSNIIVTLPAFLSRYQYVDFRVGTASVDAFRHLVSGIKGTPFDNVKFPFEAYPTKKPNKLCVVLSGPSSVGKDVVMGRLMEAVRKEGIFPASLRKFTTRMRREFEEEDSDPFIYLSEKDFIDKVDRNQIGCVRFSYGNYYGIDASFSVGIEGHQIIFVTQRLYKEIIIFKQLASDAGFNAISILLLADSETLRSRTQQRLFDKNQKTKRSAQILEDVPFIQSNMTMLNDKFDLIIDNSDHSRLAETVEASLSLIREKIKKAIVSS